MSTRIRAFASIMPVRWQTDHLVAIDQTRLPGQLHEIKLRSVEGAARAIERLQVRGAPLIGIAAAYTVAMAALQAERAGRDAASAAARAIARLARTRPTARNLFFALSRMEHLLLAAAASQKLGARLLREAKLIHSEDLAASKAIAGYAGEIFRRPGWVLTICNSGAFATGGGGTALRLIHEGCRLGLVKGVFACETRPLLQGSRLTAWELERLGLRYELLCDSAAASLFAAGRVASVVSGADRIARNGDTANKVGSLMLAVLARRAGVPNIVVAPSSTFDGSLADGDGIIVEQRSAGEVRTCLGRAAAPPDCAVYNPSFDVTPAELITAYVTEYGAYSRNQLAGSVVWN